MQVQELGTMSYRDASALQERLHADVLNGAEEHLLLLEHPPVITMGRRLGLSENILEPADSLQRVGVDVVESDRGGDVTFHGPGQLVAYPIMRLSDHKLSVGGYVHKLQDVVIAALNELGVPSRTDPSAIGVWTRLPLPPGEGRTSASSVEPGEGASEPCCVLAKVCAFGVRIRRGVAMHGLALNVTTDLAYFNLIVPCGIPDRAVTSLEQILGERCPPMPRVKQALVASFERVFRLPSFAAESSP